MSKLGKQALSKPKAPMHTAEFTKPLWYSKGVFGISTEQVISYCLDIPAVEMKKSFRLFEEMPNVHEWPISRLIQRELDKERALMISRDYLLSAGYLKYFPPLTAVLIPTNRDNMPEDQYGESHEDELDALKKYIALQEQEAASFVSPSSIIAGGIYDINSGENDNGLLLWDQCYVNAVVIDGQHRYKALMEAMRENKDFLNCLVQVNVIDIASVCKRVGKGPTSIARELFVSINNTPVEVDEARLVLMDDRDALATFTQVLVDDNEKAFPPAVQPELIDWRCDQGKHDIVSSMSGILTLRGVVLAAMFENRSIASVDERSIRKYVQKWLASINQWIKPDEAIKERFGHDETLAHRFELACEASMADEEEDECQPFLFSYSAAAASVIKERFRDLYLPVFREVFSSLTPYFAVREIALNNGAFDKKKPLHRYLRAFATQREELLKENAEMKQEVVMYKAQLKAFSENHVLLTVMGQKALFKALFELYLSDAEINSNELLDHAKSFVQDFNNAYDLVHKSNAIDECFFSVRMRLKKGVETTKAGDLGREFWRGIILGYNGEIDYGPTAIDLLKQTIIDILSHEDGSEFVFGAHEKIVARHIGILRKHNSDIEDEKANSIAEKIVAAKEHHVTNLIAN
jgi:hypothetical protein